jgi:lipid II:glycine glycyltransferase (peptidoglycan interpeptide bridge formation enzyme)
MTGVTICGVARVMGMLPSAGAQSATSTGIDGLKPADRLGSLRTVDAAWDGFVAASPLAAFPQLTAWAEAMAHHGWTSTRVVTEAGSGPVGAQLLLWRMRPGPWSWGYAPRGPIARQLDRAGTAAFTAAMRETARSLRLTHVVIDPEIETGDSVEGWLSADGWRRIPPVQCNVTRVIDLDTTEEAAWAALHPKWRQNVNRARRAGVVIAEVGRDRFEEFRSIYLQTAQRIGFQPRAVGSIYDAFAGHGAARLLVARVHGETPVAAFLLLDCGQKVTVLFGGSSELGLETRAAYLLEWEVIRSSHERGLAVYDMWGTDSPRIATFKSGFGGRERRYLGAWVLVTDRAGYLAQAGVQRVLGTLRAFLRDRSKVSA